MNKTITVNNALVNWKLIDQEVVFLHNKEKAFYELNKTASFIWLNASGKRTVKEIAKNFASRFIIDREKARKDVAEFINKAIKEKVFIFSK